MRVCVVGAGVAGLVAAVRLREAGHEPVVFERWPGLGGQAATLDVGGGVRLERYYHHWFTSDRAIADLCAEVGVELEWLPSSVAFLAGGRLHPFTSPLDLLRFRPLPLRDRVRMGVAVLRLQRAGNDVAPYERETAATWVRRTMGARAWEQVWGPLMRGKFGARAEDISMGWLWSKLTLRRRVGGREAREERLGYPTPSFEALLQALAARAGDVRLDAPVARIARGGDGAFAVTQGRPGSFRDGHDPRTFEAAGPPERFDAVLATVPSDVFAQLLDPALEAAVGPAYLERLGSIEYHAALCLLLEVDRRVMPFYWTNVADPEVPFVGLVEHTNLVGPERYGGRRFLYVANYTSRDDPLLALDADALLEHYLPGLRRAAPGFSRDWVKARWRFTEPAAQPIVDVGYRDRIAPLQTPVPGLVLANTTQIYPEDRGTNYAVVLGERATRTVLGSA